MVFDGEHYRSRDNRWYWNGVEWRPTNKLANWTPPIADPAARPDFTSGSRIQVTLRPELPPKKYLPVYRP